MNPNTFRSMTFSETSFGNKSDIALKQSDFLLQASRVPLADGALVPSWRDTFGRGEATQAVVAKQATFDIDGLNGKPCVKFETDDYCATDIVADHQDATFIFAGKRTINTVGTNETIFGCQASSTTRSFLNMTDGYLVLGSGGSSIYSLARPGISMVPFVGTAIRTGGVVTIRINGVQERQSAYTGTAINGKPYYLGANNNNGTPTFFSNSNIGRLLFAKSALPLATIQNIERKFGAELGISIA
jgi:hypothetical protein